MDSKPYFQCYSVPLKNKLEQHGFKSEFKAKNCKTDRVFWLFLFDKEGKLQNILDNWSSNKPTE